MGQHRSTHRHGGKVIELEVVKLRHRLRQIAADHIRCGRRMAYRLLRRKGWTVNQKRVQRFWREEGLQRPIPRTRKRARPADGSVRRYRAEHPHQVWAMDFQFDATADGRRLKSLNVIDEHSRLCLAIRVGRRCKAKDVVAVLKALTGLYQAPAFIRSDNGPDSSPRPDVAGARPAEQPRPPSSQDPRCRTGLRSRMSSARLRLQATLGPPGAYAPGGSSTGSCRMTTTIHSHQAWTDQGGHVGVQVHAQADGKTLDLPAFGEKTLSSLVSFGVNSSGPSIANELTLMSDHPWGFLWLAAMTCRR
ncbi:DDE-type integrase/transposase/recombinase [Synechococcus sp. L2F]|nr:DDE-type integrase/transposase/recombinase [Synechococcus sp. L2F]